MLPTQQQLQITNVNVKDITTSANIKTAKT